MIRNLNAITFRDFGAVLSERPQNAKNTDKENGTLLKLDGKQAVVYRAEGQTQLNIGTALIVLSVSTDAETFWHFCLDKSVYIKEGIYFTLNPFEGAAEVRMYAKEEPTLVDCRDAAQLRMDKILCIY